MDIVLLSLALLGHAILWIAMVNRTHATALARSFINTLTAIGFACLGLIPIALGACLVWHGLRLPGPNDWLALPRLALLYLALCWMIGAIGIVRWLWHWVTYRPPNALRWHRSRSIRLAQRSSGQPASTEHMHHFLAHLPGNQILHLDYAQRALDVPRLPGALDGLTVLHVSDLHLTGRVGKAFFEEVVHLGNEQQPDLVAITGDLVDTDACIDWLPDTLGKLTGRYGVYFVLGNHDLRVDTQRLRRTLVDLGLIDLGGHWLSVDIGGWPIIMAGNELPWIAPAADMRGAPARGADGGPPRILLSHSPDQLDWAMANDFDLMLAGHLHGGQIRLPLLGAVVSPSHQGVRFSSGTFQRGPTIMHVSRGLSGELPIRLNCPPELTTLVLHAPREAVRRENYWTSRK